jgi:hypothetical protein
MVGLRIDQGWHPAANNLLIDEAQVRREIAFFPGGKSPSDDLHVLLRHRAR